MKVKICLWCKKNKAQSPFTGEYDEDSNTCLPCLEKSYSQHHIAVQGEWTRSTNVERTSHSKDILQPIKKDGTINKHFVQAHGTQSLQKELKMNDRAIRESAEKYG